MARGEGGTVKRTVWVRCGWGSEGRGGRRNCASPWHSTDTMTLVCETSSVAANWSTAALMSVIGRPLSLPT